MSCRLLDYTLSLSTVSISRIARVISRHHNEETVLAAGAKYGTE